MNAFIVHLRGTLQDMTGLLNPAFGHWAFLGLLLDGLIGDPVFRWHPIRLLGRLLSFFEFWLFRFGLTGYGGGILLLVLLTGTVLPLVLLFLTGARMLHPYAFYAAAVLVVWACIALRDLISHAERIAEALSREDLPAARKGISMLVGRDTDRMDLAACGRGAIESMSENLVDGVLSPLLFILLFGPLGGVFFKIVSTMDSMVGYKIERYLRFGWCGARTDDVLNYPVARYTFLLICGLSAMLSGYNCRKAWRSGLKFHALVPGPNSGWPEASMAGALGIRLIGPIYKNGIQVADVWLGDPADPAGANQWHIRYCYVLLIMATLLTLIVGVVASLLIHF